MTLSRGRRRHRSEFCAAREERGDHEITERRTGRLRDANSFAMHKSEKREDSRSECEARCAHELSVDNEYRNRSEYQASKNRAAAEEFQAPIKHALVSHFIHELFGRAVDADCGEGPVNEIECPGREVRHDGEDDRGSMASRCFLKRL